jgi:phosphatidate cytidylyltransferase
LNLSARITSSAAVALFVAVGTAYAPELIFSLGATMFAGIALFELLSMLKAKGVQVYRVFGVAVGALMPMVVYVNLGLTESGDVLFVVLSCFCLFVMQFVRRENPRALEGIALTFFSMMYIGWFLSFIVKLKFLPGGPMWILFLIVGTKVADIGAFAIGTLWGKHSLIPHISPNKTIEGTLAGLVTSALVAMLFYGRLPVDFSIIHLAILGGSLGFVGQCGDLSESLIKRYCGAKDSGQIIPGFGGMLDVLDSILFTTPLLYFYIKTLN